jgi:hypothetical protein
MRRHNLTEREFWMLFRKLLRGTVKAVSGGSGELSVTRELRGTLGARSGGTGRGTVVRGRRIS